VLWSVIKANQCQHISIDPRFSGITAEMLEGETTTLEDVQKALIEILPSDAILIGQSLNSDLLAMQV
jgi:RNA exonuclease 1